MKTICNLLIAAIVTFQCKAQTADTATARPQKQLQAVTVISKTPLIRQEADRIIYDLLADPQSKVSSVLDMMRKVPYLSVDADDNVLLNGSSSYKIFINGRPSGLVERNPKDVLRSMPASTIKSIEVITNPPAKYDAEGLAGIINIVTYRQLISGYRGTVNIHEKWPVGGPGGGTSFTVKHGKVDLSGLAGATKYDVPETHRELNRTGIGPEASTLKQYILKHSHRLTSYAGAELNYEPDSLDLLSLQLNWTKTNATRSFNQSSTLMGADKQYYRLDNDDYLSDGGMGATATYQKEFKNNKDQMLNLTYRYHRGNNTQNNDIIISNEINYTIPDYRQHSSGAITEHAAQVDYAQPLRKLVMESGLKGICRSHKNSFEYLSLDETTGQFEEDTTRSNIFTSTQNILSVYSSYTYRSERWHLKGGLRVEHTMTDVYSANNLAPIKQNYLNILPSVFIERKLKRNSSLNFSFSKRLQRPTSEELNPFVDRSNPNFEPGGNPYLLPITSDNYQLSYMISGKATFNISVGHMYFSRVITPFPFYDSSANITSSRYNNFGKCKVYKTNMSLRYPITEKWNFTFESDIRHVTYYGVANNIKFENSGPGVYLYASGAYSFDKGWRANADITYKMGGILLPIGRTNGFIASSFSVNKNIFTSRLTVSAAVNNPFTKYRYTDESISSVNFTQTTLNQSYYRRFTLSLNYRFGKLKEETRKDRRGISIDDAAT